MSITHDRPEGEAPWYLLKSSILMITVTILAIVGLAFDVVSRPDAPASGYRIIENGVISGGDRSETERR